MHWVLAFERRGQGLLPEGRKISQFSSAVLLLMEHRNISNDEAHRLLRKLAMDQGKRLPEVARALVSMAGVLS